MVGQSAGRNAEPASVGAAEPSARRGPGKRPNSPTRSDRPDGADEKSMESPSSPTVTQPAHNYQATQTTESSATRESSMTRLTGAAAVTRNPWKDPAWPAPASLSDALCVALAGTGIWHRVGPRSIAQHLLRPPVLHDCAPLQSNGNSDVVQRRLPSPPQ